MKNMNAVDPSKDTVGDPHKPYSTLRRRNNMIHSLIAMEKPFAYLGWTGSFLAIVWKTVGVGFIPGYNQMFDSTQYPRQSTASAWDLFYLVLYGGLGTYGQTMGLCLTTDSENRKNNATTRIRARALGLFHLAMTSHHVAWALKKDWGRLDLDRFDLPGGNSLMIIWSLLPFYNSLKLLFVDETTSFDQIIRSKTIADSFTLSSFLPMVAFLPANWVGYRNFTFERNTWIFTVATGFAIFVADAFM